jgi:hypothetical protein
MMNVGNIFLAVHDVLDEATSLGTTNGVGHAKELQKFQIL